jgi:hypothetical protein
VYLKGFFCLGLKLGELLEQLLQIENGHASLL